MANDDDFAAMFEASQSGSSAKSVRRLRRGETVEGVVVAIDGDTIFVDVGAKAEGRIPLDGLRDAQGQATVRIGDRLRATVADPNGPELVVAFGRGNVDALALALAAEAGTKVEGQVTKVVKAGLEVDVGGVRAFCPASQVDLAYVADLERFVGQHHFFRVLEVRDGGRSVVLSRRALLAAERDERAKDLVRDLTPGVEVDGIVQSIHPYGAFVDLGGVNGLIHVSELSHTRGVRPTDVVAVGDPVRVKVVAIEPAPGGQIGETRISLSLRALADATATTSAPAEEIVTGVVTRVDGAGLHVETPSGGGFVPARELILAPGADPRRTYPVGKQLEVVVQRRDPRDGRLRLSVKAVDDVRARREFEEFETTSKQRSGGSGRLGSLGDLLRDKVDTDPRDPSRRTVQR